MFVMLQNIFYEFTRLLECLEVLNNFLEVVEALEYLYSFKIFFYDFTRLLECLEVSDNFSEVLEAAECLYSFKIFLQDSLSAWRSQIIFQKF